MRETIRHFISCIFPCGALDVVRVVHTNGHVEEISHPVQAGEIMQAHPKHVLRELPSASGEAVDVCPRIRSVVLIPPTTVLRRGKIYFLVPTTSSSPQEKKPHPTPEAVAAKRNAKKKKKKRQPPQEGGVVAEADTARLLASDRYLKEIISEKVSAQGNRRRGRVGVWRPHLESISEVSSEF